MTYDNIVHGIFLRRLNRFVCEVQVNGEVFRRMSAIQGDVPG